MSFGDITQSGTNTVQSASSIAVTLGSTPTEGNLLVACHFTGHANSIAPSGFSEAVALTDTPNTDQGAIYYKVAGSGESTTITATSGGSNEQTLTVLEIEGPWNASPLDVTASAGPSSTSTRDTGTTGTTAQADEVAVAMVTWRHSDQDTTTTWSDSFVEQSENVRTNYKGHSTATKLLTSTGTVTTTATMSNTLTSMGGVALFKKQAAGGGLSIPVAMRYYRNQRT